MFFLVLTEHSCSIFLLDNDVRERRRIFSNDFKICENVFNKGFSAFFIVKLNIYRELLNHSFCKISEF